MSPHLVNLIYLVAVTLFIVGLKLLSSPRTAKVGNIVGATGMAVAIGVTLLGRESYTIILLAMAVGAAVGGTLAAKVKMTGMPQMVALLNGFGGLASTFVATGEMIRAVTFPDIPMPGAALTVPTVLGALIGTVTFTGSLIAWAKLQEVMPGRPIVYPLQKAGNLLLALALVTLGVITVGNPENLGALYLVCALSAVLGVTLVLPIGGADMPVVISLLNSYSGLAAAATGFAIQNNALIITGSLVGAAGVILTKIMCKAMNRSLTNVLFGAFGQVTGGAAAGGPAVAVRTASVDDVVAMLDGVGQVIVVPGYGMAVAQAQHAVKQMADGLQRRGTTVKYAIHPVAGRMPGHMNVLLAEANVPYDQLYELEAINGDFPETDVAIVIGANDTVNPAARNRPDSPLYGMPILDVDKARAVIVCKRGMGKGFAGVENDLYGMPNTVMLFGDAKETISQLASALKKA